MHRARWKKGKNKRPGRSARSTQLNSMVLYDRDYKVPANSNLRTFFRDPKTGEDIVVEVFFLITRLEEHRSRLAKSLTLEHRGEILTDKPCAVSHTYLLIE